MTDLRALLASSHVSPATRRAIEPRLEDGPWPDPPLLSEAERRTLAAVADRLVPETPGTLRPNLAKAFEYRLSAPEGKGWRYATLPSELETMRRLLGLVDAVGGRPFADLPDDEQDAALTTLQRGAFLRSDGELDAPRAFEDLLAMLAECYATDPAVLVAVGYVGFADLPRWERVGLDEHDERELPTPTLASHG